MVVAWRRTTLSCNGIEGCSGFHSSPSSDISEPVFCIVSGQYAKSKFDWQQQTPTQRSAALSTAQSLHFQIHGGTRWRFTENFFRKKPSRRGSKCTKSFPSFFKNLRTGPPPSPGSGIPFSSHCRQAVLITPKGTESPGSRRIGVIGALVLILPSETV